MSGVSPGLGLLVGVVNHDTDAPLVITGQCACVRSEDPLQALEGVGLPTPDWVATGEQVAEHFPAGCVVCGVYVRLGECAGDYVKKVVGVLCEETDVQVCELGSKFASLVSHFLILFCSQFSQC